MPGQTLFHPPQPCLRLAKDAVSPPIPIPRPFESIALSVQKPNIE